MGKQFEGKNLEECLKKAELELKISKDDLDYKIIKQEKGIFSKKVCQIEVDTNCKDEEIEKIEEETNLEESQKTNVEAISMNGDEIILDKDDTSEYEIYFDPDIKVTVNGIKVANGEKVTSKDEIKCKCEEIPPKKSIKIDVSPMSAVATTTFEPSYIGKITCMKIDKNIRIKKEMIEGTMAPLYKENEIKTLLLERKVIFGYVKEGIEKVCNEYNAKNVEIAKGVPLIDDEPDNVEIFFENNKNKLDEDSKENIDYRNLYAIASVAAGDKIAELKVGKLGQDGTDIFGKHSEKKLKKPIELKIGQGCKVEGNSVIAIIDGRPTIKSGMFHIHKVLQNPGDVDIKSGNIKFLGDVKVDGSVKTGMTVESGNSVEINGSVEESKIISQGEARLNGSLINSELIVGTKDLIKQNYIEALSELKSDVEDLVQALMDVKERNLLGNGKSDGQIVKILIETKFKNLQKKSLRVLNGQGGKFSAQISNFIRHKIIGMGPLKIKFTSELHEFLGWIKEELQAFSGENFIPVDAYIKYSQDSKIECTGTVYIEGKGEYVSDISAKGDVIFTVDKAVARGGTIIAGRKIVAKTVGSSAGVTTTLKVPVIGQITADIVYQNTVFYFGKTRYVLERASKNVNAFVDNKGEIVVEKFVL